MNASTASLIAVTEVLAARRRLRPYIRRTPLIHSPWLSGLSGGEVHLKLETLQLTNSFKVRGAFNALLQFNRRPASFPASRRTSSDVVSVVTASAGNHGRGIAYAAEALGIGATVFTPANAPETKLAAIARHGADLRAVAADYDEAERMAKAFARETDTAFVSPYSDRGVIAGAATIAIELMEDLPRLDTVIVPLGGGGLMSGVVSVIRQLSPSSRIIGVEAQASPAFHTSLAAGVITPIDVSPTLADGLAGNMDPDTITFDIIKQTIDHVELLSEEELSRAIRGLVAEEHLIAEGAAATGVAAVMAGRLDLKRRQIVVVLSGANIDAGRLSGLLSA